MIPFQERKKFRKVLYSKATLLVLLGVSIFVTRGAWQVYQKAAIARAERVEAERSLAELDARTEGFEASIARLKSEQGIEEEIRQKFTVARPNEEVVVIVDETDKKSKNGEVPREQSFWKKLLNF